MALPRRTWRNPWLWPVTQLGVLLFPLVTAWRLGLEVGSQGDAAFAGDAMITMTGVWATLCGLLLGAAPELFVPPAMREDQRAKVTAVSRRMLAVLVVVPLSMAIVEPVDLMDPGPVWRRIALMMAAVVVPVWAASLLARIRGLGPVLSLVVVLPWGGLVIGSTLVVGGFAYLDRAALQTAMAAAGVVGSIGLYLAVTEAVTASLGRVLGAVGLLAAALGAAVTWRLSNPALDMAWVIEPVGASTELGEVFIRVQEPNLRGRIFSIGVETGLVAPLPHGVADVEFVGRRRVMARMTPRLPLVRRTVRLCMDEPGGAERCVNARFGPRSVHVDGNGSDSLVLMVTRHGIVIWNMDTDAAWQVRRPHDVVRWPCFDEDGGVIWRLQTAEGPFQQERLDLATLPVGAAGAPPEVSDFVQSLSLEHGFQCDPGAEVHTAGRFVRGRALVGRPHVLHGPGLPGGQVELSPNLGAAAWSSDGGTFMYGIGDERVRFYRPEFGLSDPVKLPNMVEPALSPDGALVAHVDGPADGAGRFMVRSVPDGAAVLRFKTETGKAAWLEPGMLLLVDAGRLVRLDARTGAEDVLFPRTGQLPEGP